MPLKQHHNTELLKDRRTTNDKIVKINLFRFISRENQIRL
ncbi:hypothetical protein ALIPUT_00179 [Alistipes putredinis DSM 17216]|uniref:Uncharacterized protein n=1 Tax=Alistipes putredinis DSM 17216 TaxID=445970 RepID=B0MU61_9BACT|nr:hypothetical protein ALIPUT_00179 [Alistipes putredinis DSM 17216]